MIVDGRKDSRVFWLGSSRGGGEGGDGKFCLSSPVTGAELTAGEAGQEQRTTVLHPAS